jgi:hypothetical protein
MRALTASRSRSRQHGRSACVFVAECVCYPHILSMSSLGRPAILQED